MRTPSWVRTTLVLVAGGLLVTTSIFAQNLSLRTLQGVHRPHPHPLTAGLHEAIRTRVAQSPEVEIVLMAASPIDHGFGLEVVPCAERRSTVDQPPGGPARRSPFLLARPWPGD